MPDPKVENVVNTPSKTLDYIKRTSAFISQTEKQAAELEKKAAAVSALIPDVVDALIKNNKVSEDLREKAAQMLTDHEKTLEILASVAAYRSDAEKAHLGTSVSKSASASGGFDASRGAKEEERESDAFLFQRFGIR